MCVHLFRVVTLLFELFFLPLHSFRFPFFTFGANAHSKVLAANYYVLQQRSDVDDGCKESKQSYTLAYNSFMNRPK